MATLVRPRLYLDVDGVLNAHAPLWGDSAATHVSVNYGGGYRVRYTITYSPTLVDEIEQLRTDFDLELVWLTTWLEDDDALFRLTRQLGNLKSGRKLEVPLRKFSGSMPYGWKTAQLLSDQAANSTYGPAPFIWADDEEIYDHRTEVTGVTAGTSSLMVEPDQEVGLTPQHLLEMREFLAGLAG